MISDLDLVEDYPRIVLLLQTTVISDQITCSMNVRGGGS